ncbi:hypothetical protein PVAND_001385 [Polypedilum vanderplanki]|uniref:TIR domain-containing protein n=1 Tax=Polypedilum vanderplanki TaxID=319348 RepID=A0A9J6BP32_POLVA|nr:hypothetical protein PVAND_001385 [Polypedilum vanderplanki]
MTKFKELLVLLVLSVFTATSSKILKCPVNDNGCHCSEYGELEIQCPKFDPRIFVKIQPNNFLNFECENTQEGDYNLVPEMELPEAQMIKIMRCPLPQQRSLATYFKNIKIERILWLQIFSGGVNGHSSLRQVHLRGFEDITRFHLRGNDNEFQDLPSDLFANMSKLAWVTIRVGNIQLPVDLFAPLENLEFLELGHNKVANLEPGMLRNNRKLQQLNLWGNNLRNLDKEAFFGLDNLRELDLSTNGMESLEPDLFMYLTSLTHLNLGGNNFASLPEGLFANNPKLTIFKMLENRVTMDTLPNGFLSNLTMLSDVYIKSGLRKIPEDTFENSINISIIRLDGNELEVLPEELFMDQVRLSKLDLSNNWLNELPLQIFANTRDLKELRLNNNRLSKLPSQIFQRLGKLTELHLDNNQLVSLPSGIFESLKALRSLDLSNNGLRFEMQFGGNFSDSIPVSSRFQGLESLEELNLRNNSITSIFEDFTLQSLKYVDMSHNKMTSLLRIDLQFSSRSPITVDLSNNQIEHIEFSPKDDELLSSQTQVNLMLAHNPIICDCQLLHFVKFLQNENREKSNIKVQSGEMKCAMPERMQGRELTSINALELLCPLDDASSTKEKRCPAACISCDIRREDKTLLMNCLGNVSMSSLPKISESDLDHLELRMEKQNITELPGSDNPGYQQITKLYVNDNNIKYIGELPKNLVVLELENNQIESLNDSVIDALNNSQTLQSLKLSGNPWKCDCDFVKMLNFLQKFYKNITDYSEMMCTDGQFINQLSASALCSEDKLLIVIASIILAILSLVIGVLAALYYKYQKQIKMWLYSHNMCLWFVTEEELDKDKTYDAFVSYAHQDGDFITDQLVPHLENCVVPYKLCLHERDWSPGLEISTQISNSINDSKRTIVVMSPHYLNSNWAQWEFRVAQSHAATEKRSRIIVILYGDIGDINKLEPDIRDYLKLNTYVKWGDKWFWEKLRYAMPHVKGQGPLDKSKGLVKTAIKSSVDDKLELIKPVSVTPPQLTTPPAEQIANPLITKLNAKNAAKTQQHHQNGGLNGYNGHINGAYVINTSSRQSDV